MSSTRRCALVIVVVCASLFGCVPSEREPTQGTPLRFPETRTVDVVDTIYGTAVPDPYRWLEELDEPEVRAWAAAQTAVTRRAVRDRPVRAWFESRIEAHAKAWDAYDETAPASPGAGAIELQSVSEDERRRVVVREADGSTRVLADPGAEQEGVSVSRVEASPDGVHAVVQWSEGGSEWVTTRILRVADGFMLDETLDGLLWSTPIWTRDGAGFFYVRYGRPPPGQRVMFQGTAIRYHVVGTPQSSDHLVLSTMPGDVELILDPSLSSDGRYLVISEGTGADTEGLGQLMARLLLLDLGNPRSPDVTGQPVPITEDRVAGYHLVGVGDDGALHVITDRAAPRRRVVAIDPSSPSPASWRELIPERADLLNRIYRQGDYYVGVYLRDAQAVVRVYTLEGRLLHTVDLPPFSTVMDVGSGSSDQELVLGHSSFVRAPSRTYVDLETGAIREGPEPPETLIGGPYEVTRTQYPSSDGVMVPMFLVHREEIELDGSHPVILHGYGASHTPDLPWFDELIPAWVEAGGVYAVPNLRGGGAFGRAWWEAAILDRKQTTFDDFIAGAEYLIREGWTKPERLAINGVSFGGLLVTAVLTERPDLFGAAVAEVPATDLVRFDLGRHRAQMGSPDDPEQFRFLLRHSPLHRVRPGQCYPATLLTTSFTDERLPAWQAFKFTAALQAAQSCDRPVLLRADQVGGHVGQTPSAWVENWVDWLTFVATALDVTPVPA